MHEGHSHSPAHAGAGRLRLVLLLTTSYMGVELVGGLLTGSLALIADAGHMMTDVFGVGMALAAIWFANRPATPAKTYGYYRLEILAALANGFLLVGVAVYILWEASQRIGDAPEILGAEMLVVASVGLLVNLVSAYLLFEGQKNSLNLRGAFLEVVSDLLGSVAVIVAGLVIILTGWEGADLVASAFIGLFIVPRTWHLMGEAIHVLLEGTPRGIDLDHIRNHILGTEDVVSVHDLHVWSMTSGVPVMSAHVVIKEGASTSTVLDRLCACLLDHFDIEHSTFQLERADRGSKEPARH